MSTNIALSATAQSWLCEALGLATDETPFPWQIELLARWVNGEGVRSLDIPTGLGKTATIAIWLIARAVSVDPARSTLPRRLVYVVDRRAVVDQATEVAEGLRKYVERNAALKKALGLAERSLPIATLRGQHVDSREWLEDPAAPAIIVGTVDMIGSRLLFEGYGVTRKMRPYHAGLLGADTLLVLDEAHLVPPFQKLVESIADDVSAFGPRDASLRELLPRFRVVSLSATGRSVGDAFGLGPLDDAHPVVRKRLDAVKRLLVREPLATDEKALAEALAEEAWTVTDHGRHCVRCIIFCDRREDAVNTAKALERLAQGQTPELFVGGRRVHERVAAAERLHDLGFLGPRMAPTRATFVVATSAAEVGVDLDADHMVCDLVAWERMVQRLGRVNRRGEGDAQVIVLETKPDKKLTAALEKDPDARNSKETAAVARHAITARARDVLDALPMREGARDASPGALRELKRRAETDPPLRDLIDAATTTTPLRPGLSRAVVEAWSLTSLRDHTGRPEIAPWLRGWLPDDLPQTSVVWRHHLPIRSDGTAPQPSDIEGFFEAAWPHTSEVLEMETFRVVAWLADRFERLSARRQDERETSEHQAAPDAAESETIERVRAKPLRSGDLAAFVLTQSGELRDVLRVESLAELSGPARDRRVSAMEKQLGTAILVVDVRVGGLLSGLLDRDSDTATASDPEPAPEGTREWPDIGFRVRGTDSETPPGRNAAWREHFRLPIVLSDDGTPERWLVVENQRREGTTEDGRSTSNPQLLAEHQAWTETHARRLATALALPETYVAMLALAARLHDEGKRAGSWQRAFRAQAEGPGIYAKTSSRPNVALLDGYRHEFGSLPYAEQDTEVRNLEPDLRDLALHLIAAHHGFARPVIATSGCEDAPPSALVARARMIALRFSRLQKRWGPWGLAWWEALLRAADQQASRDNDELPIPGKERG